MKQIIYCAGLILITGLLNAQSVTPTSTITPGGGIDKTLAAPTDRTSVAPPEHITTRFNNEYPGKNSVSWKVEGNNYWVTYTDPKTNMVNVIVYDKEGKIIRKESEADKNTYPSDIGDFYSKQYPKEKYKVWQTEKEPGKTYYFITRKGKLIWFDQTGKNISDPTK
ncbi:MAG: hypothetical protein H0W61_16170 [Bacteroidetes bacterium]|nr:hypothetical protein [Bacteroidota bacterium]